MYEDRNKSIAHHERGSEGYWRALSERRKWIIIILYSYYLWYR